MSPEAAIQAYNEQVRAENAKVAPHAIRAYNAKAGMYEAGLYEQVVKKRGGQLPEGFTIVKVRTARLSCMSHPCLPWGGYLPQLATAVRAATLFGNQPEPPCGHPGVQRGYLIWQPT